MSNPKSIERGQGSARATEPAAFVSEFERLLAGDMPARMTREMRRLLEHDLFRRQEGLTDHEVTALGYRRARFLAAALGIDARELATDPRRLFALHEWLGSVDGVACTVLSIHYCLCLGSILIHGGDRPELRPFVAELERMDSVGVFLATELGYGNSVASLETRAVYDAARREFSLLSPTPQSSKFMPNTGHPVPKLAVVMARLIVGQNDHGVFPFIVRLRGRDGAPCRGVSIARLTEKPGYALDNAVTRFDGVRVPKEHLLAGDDSVLHDDGRFESHFPSHRQRFLAAMDRVQTGRVCFTSAAAACLRAATWIAVRYTSQRLAPAPGKQLIPILRFRNVQRDVFGALATAYALSFAVRYLQRRFRQRTRDSEHEIFRLTATLKAVVTAEVSETLPSLRERCGAVGMLSHNRILEYWTQLQGAITAEGDNQLMLLKAGRQLFDGPSLVGADAPPAACGPLTPEAMVALFRFREARLREDLKDGAAAARRRTREPLAIWNDNVNRTLALATAHGARIVAECFYAACAECHDADGAALLRTLFCLWAVAHIERHAGWFMGEGCLERSFAAEAPSERDRLCASLEPHVESLVAAFGLDNRVLRAPIAEDDYVATYHALSDTPDTSLRGSGTYRVASADDLPETARSPARQRG